MDITDSTKFNVGTILSDAPTDVVVSVAKLDTDTTVSGSSDLSGKSFVAATDAALNSAGTQVEVTPSTMGSTAYTGYTLTITADDVTGASVENTSVTVTVVITDNT